MEIITNRMVLSVERLPKDDDASLRLLGISDEAHFHLSGALHKQNCHD